MIENAHAISSIEDILEDARNGRPYILVDAADRENEGDVIVPAQFATPDRINFMARYARGLICLALTSGRARELRLPPMSSVNGTRMGTAFTVSIEAREGISTGISAADRARTIQTAIDRSRGPDDLVSPGHVFPLTARDGGVLVRAGHTEAAVDLSRMAGLNPSAVICEVMNDDGSMARLDDLIAFGRVHGIRIGTITDLIAYRRRTERYVERLHEGAFESAVGGSLRLVLYRNTVEGGEHVALVRGRISAEQPTLVRMHRVDLADDLLSRAGGRHGSIEAGLRAIADFEGPAVLVLIRDTAPESALRSLSPDARQDTEPDASERGIGAQILSDLGVRDLILLGSAPPSRTTLTGHGLRLVGVREFSVRPRS